MNFVIRSATAADVPALVEIERLSFAIPHWKAKDFLKYDCLVAEIQGQIAGFIISRTLFAGDGANPGQREILNVAVAPDWRRRGVATALISHEISSPGEFFLEVRESNLAAQEVYRKLGFAEVGRRPKYYETPAETAIVMNMKWC